MSASNYGEAVGKITKTNKITGGSFKSLLEKVDGFKAGYIDTLMKAITASAAFGIDQGVQPLGRRIHIWDSANENSRPYAGDAGRCGT